MPSPQKAKGSGFEREVARFLSDLYGESFIRVPNSGAYIGGKNKERKQVLHEGQVRSFKGDIIPGQSFTKLNAECKSYADFPFNLAVTGECKVLEGWLNQMMGVAEPDDLNVLFMKFNRKGRFAAIETKYDWTVKNFLHYSSIKHNDWIITDFDNFFELNKDLFKALCGSTDTKSLSILNQHYCVAQTV